MKKQFLLATLLFSFNYVNCMNSLDLNNLPKKPSKILQTDGDFVTSIAFNQEGSQLAAGTYDGVNIWKAHPKKEPLARFDKCGIRIAYNRDSTLLACSGDKKIELMNTLTGKSVKIFEREYVRSLIFEGNKLYSNSSDCTIKVIDIESDQSDILIESDDQHFLYLAGDGDDGRYLATSLKPREVCIYDKNNKMEIMKFSTASVFAGSKVSAIAFNPDDPNYLATATEGHMLTPDQLLIWDLRSINRSHMKCLYKKDHFTSLLEIVYHPRGGQLFVSGITDNVLWEPETDRMKKFCNNVVNSSAFNPRQNELAYGSGSVVCVWDLNNAHDTNI